MLWSTHRPAKVGSDRAIAMARFCVSSVVAIASTGAQPPGGSGHGAMRFGRRPTSAGFPQALRR